MTETMKELTESDRDEEGVAQRVLRLYDQISRRFNRAKFGLFVGPNQEIPQVVYGAFGTFTLNMVTKIGYDKRMRIAQQNGERNSNSEIEYRFQRYSREGEISRLIGILNKMRLLRWLQESTNPDL